MRVGNAAAPATQKSKAAGMTVDPLSLVSTYPHFSSRHLCVWTEREVDQPLIPHLYLCPCSRGGGGGVKRFPLRRRSWTYGV